MFSTVKTGVTNRSVNCCIAVAGREPSYILKKIKKFNRDALVTEHMTALV